MSSDDKTSSDLTKKFNSLSWHDQAELCGLTLIKAVTGVIREDVKKHLWKYPFHVALAAFLTLPIPVPGTGIVKIPLAIGVAAAIVKWGPEKWWVRERLAPVFNKQALMETNKDFISSDVAHPEKLHVHKVALTKHVMKGALADLGATLAYPYVKVQDALKKPQNPQKS